MRELAKGVVAVLGVFTASAAWAGPDWKEGFLGATDAGPLPFSAQLISGSPFLSPLHTISGQLGANGLVGPGDFQDMYGIYITDINGFRATTDTGIDLDAFTSFNSQLFLFDASGSPIAASDGAGPGATLTIPSIIRPFLTPGMYFLAISGFDSDPVDGLSAPLFPNVTGVTVPPSNFNPIGGWTTGSIGGSYTIALEEAAFVPGPGGLAIVVAASVATSRRRRTRR